jgi:hypothetical protein
MGAKIPVLRTVFAAFFSGARTFAVTRAGVVVLLQMRGQDGCS